MGQNDGDADILGNTYPATWKREITATNESRLRQAYSIPSSIKLRFDNKDTSVVVHAKEKSLWKICSKQV
jgi:hypothetical protein